MPGKRAGKRRERHKSRVVCAQGLRVAHAEADVRRHTVLSLHRGGQALRAGRAIKILDVGSGASSQRGVVEINTVGPGVQEALAEDFPAESRFKFSEIVERDDGLTAGLIVGLGVDPKMGDPATVAAPCAATLGSWRSRRCVGGEQGDRIWHLAQSDTAVGWQSVELQVVIISIVTVLTQPAPQSCANRPTPKMPLAPNAATVSSSVPVPEQAAGMFVKFGSPMTCTGTECAVSPEICTSAKATGPQLYPSTNCVHSTSESLFVRVCTGKVKVSTGASMRSP